MTPLQLPYQLGGPWERALFLSYGADFSFFETTLWPQFTTRCRQKIILLDGEQFWASKAEHAEDGLIRHLNHRYLATGVFRPHAVHAKMILLANQERGCLLVGSGNLNWQGYASGGELFCVYPYDEENGDYLAAFVVARELLESFITQKEIDPFAARHVRQFLENIPWIHRSMSDASRPVRHNLDESFLSQLEAALGDEPVEELSVMAPFYDVAAEGLRQLLARLQPKETHLLLQPKHTSVDSASLARVIADFPNPVSIHAIDKAETSYLHAKLYLVKTGRRALCLQGSANLSQVAMLRPTRNGNAELCNLLEGSRDTFDYLLEELVLNPVVDVGSLELSLRQEDIGPLPPTAESFYLTAGEWDGKRVTLYFRGALPNLVGCQLQVGDRLILVIPQRSEGNRLILEIGNTDQTWFNEPVPIKLLWIAGPATRASNPVYLYHHAHLNAELQARADGDTFSGIGNLDIDEDLEQLVADLESALVIDRRGVWRLAGHRKKIKNLSGDVLDVMPLTYENIDYEALRSHPKTQQYLQRGSIHHDMETRSRLQIILSMITGRFDNIAAMVRDPSILSTDKEALPSDSGAETEAEREAEEAERQRKQKDKEQQLRQIFKRFIGRYLSGLGQQDFQQLVGHEVLSNNYIIFDHLLWELSLRDWFQQEAGFLVETQLKTWEIFWGAGSQEGYFNALGDTERKTVLSWLREQKSDARLLAAVCRAAKAVADGQVETRLRLRDFWRHVLTIVPFMIDQAVLTDMWVIAAQTSLINPPTAGSLIDELRSLAIFETEIEFRRSIEQDCGFAAGSCQFELHKEYVVINSRKTLVERRHLCIREPNDAVTPQIGQRVLERWIQYEKRDWYRISFGRVQDRGLKVILSNQEGIIYWDESTGTEIALDGVHPASWPWDVLLAECGFIAEQIGQANLPGSRVMESDIDSLKLTSRLA